MVIRLSSSSNVRLINVVIFDSAEDFLSCIIDMIAIPDFSSGAMENWGLITYRETALLIEEGVSSESNRQRVSVVVSHELAHMVGSMKLTIQFIFPLGS